ENIMKLNTQIVGGIARPAASVILLRDGTAGLEVYLMRRHDLSNAFAGAYVFPGGKVDACDAELDMEAHLDRPLTDLHLALNDPDLDSVTNAGLYVTAIREVF